MWLFKHLAMLGIFLLYEFCYIVVVIKKRRFLQAIVAGGAVSLVQTRSLQSRIGGNRVLLTKDPSSTVVPVVEPPLFESPSGLIIDQRPPDLESIILEETVLEEGFKHTERDIDLNDLEDTEVDE